MERHQIDFAIEKGQIFLPSNMQLYHHPVTTFDDKKNRMQNLLLR